MQRFAISSQVDAEILQIIIKDRTRNLTKVSSPQLYVVAGQPGSGKTELIYQIKQSLENNILVCNADDLRNYHPDAEEILKEYESDYSDITWPYADKWNQQLMNIGVSRKFNILIETTLQNKE